MVIKKGDKIAAIGQVFYATTLTWLPVIALFYLPNTIWGIFIKVLAGIWLFGAVGQFLFGAMSKIAPLASYWIALNTLLFALFNLAIIPGWIKGLLAILIALGILTCVGRLSKEERF